LTDKNGDEKVVTAKYITIAVGGRPTFLTGIENVEKLCLTSDDIF
jgi:pyruvate/2-oxoglutarate dehydrogenase complex dihydrolipoamide dehydrogenase (E3) component